MDTTQKSTPIRLPEILTVRVIGSKSVRTYNPKLKSDNKYEYVETKIIHNSPVELIVDLESTLEPFCRDNLAYEYELLALTVHTGTAKSGHYVAFVKSNNMWWQMNDDNVYRSSEAEVLQQQPYLYFYKRLAGLA